MGSLKSRILQFLPEGLLKELDKICKDRTISDNNRKVDLMIAALDKYDVDFTELGPGTNRMAFLIDGYVFKVAMDRLGIQDNWAEFSLTSELQPFVTKVYECNGVVIVAEYVTVISKEEFINNKDQIRRILGTISDRYLLGDVGTVSKNFLNWGYRDDGELVILDFGYIYRLQGEEMICGAVYENGKVCEGFIEYDENFYGLRCPVCGKKYLFTDIRFKIDPDFEKREVEMVKQIAELVTEPMTEYDEYSERINAEDEMSIQEALNIDEGEDDDMKYYDDEPIMTDEEYDDIYMNALNELHGNVDDTEELEEPKEPAVEILDMEEVDRDAEEIVEDLDGIEIPDNEMEEIIKAAEEEAEMIEEVIEDITESIEEVIEDVIEELIEEEVSEPEEDTSVEEDEPDYEQSIELEMEEIIKAAECEILDMEEVDRDAEELVEDLDGIELPEVDEVEETINNNIPEPIDVPIIPEPVEPVEETVEEPEMIEEVSSELTIEEPEVENIESVPEIIETVIETPVAEEPVVHVTDVIKTETTSFIKIITPETEAKIEEELRESLRNELMEDGFSDEDLDEFDKLYDEAIDEQQNIKYNPKGKLR